MSYSSSSNRADPASVPGTRSWVKTEVSGIAVRFWPSAAHPRSRKVSYSPAGRQEPARPGAASKGGCGLEPMADTHGAVSAQVGFRTEVRSWLLISPQRMFAFGSPRSQPLDPTVSAFSPREGCPHWRTELGFHDLETESTLGCLGPLVSKEGNAALRRDSSRGLLLQPSGK